MASRKRHRFGALGVSNGAPWCATMHASDHKIHPADSDPATGLPSGESALQHCSAVVARMKAAGRNPGRSTVVIFLNAGPGLHPGYNTVAKASKSRSDEPAAHPLLSRRVARPEGSPLGGAAWPGEVGEHCVSRASNRLIINITRPQYD